MKAALAVAALLLAGCAGDGARALRMDPDPAGRGEGIYFPALPEVPRYFYAGTLIGEGNYVDPSARVSGVKRAFEWLAGLEAGREAPEGLLRPAAGITDAEGRVIVTDGSRPGVVVFHPTRGLETWLQADGLERFRSPVGVAVGGEGRLYVADADLGYVARLDRAGTPLGALGRGRLVRPTGVAWDAQRQRLYVVDTRAHAVVAFDAEGREVARWGRRGEGEGEFNFPTHCWYAHDELYVADTMNGRVQVLSAIDGAWRRTLGTRGLHVGDLVRPKGVTVDGEGNVYVVESYYDHLLVFDRTGRFLLAIGGLGRDVGQFYLPAGAWTDERNRVYVADMFNGRVVVLQFLGGDGAR